MVRQLLASRAKELSLYFCSLAPHQTLILMEGCIKLIQTVSVWMILLSLWILIVKFFQVLFPQSSIFRLEISEGACVLVLQEVFLFACRDLAL